MAEHNDLGKEAENRAAEYLVRKGYKIKERNWRYYHKEIDIIAEKDEYLIIVEVKSYAGREDAFAGDLVSVQKQRFIVDAAEAYLLKNNIDREVRFDIIVVSFNTNKPGMEHIEDAFIPGVNW